MASVPGLKRYTDRVLVRSQICSYINFFIGHSIPITDLAYSDVKYQLEYDQMQLIVKEVQAPESITTIWLVGMDPVTTDCQVLADTLCKNEYFKKLYIHVKIQQLKVKKTDPQYKWNKPECIRVATILCAKHLHKVTVKALGKTFNSEKPKDVENQPNGTTAKMVKWFGDIRSLNLNTQKIGVSMRAKWRHIKWLK